MPIPANLGRYQILAKIAKGGMAEVYRAKAVGIAGFERILAVKRILPQLAQQPRFIRSFIDEARIAVSLNHRNIVQIVDFGKAGDELFLAMELIDGVDLRSALQQALTLGPAIPLPVALYILADVAAGLEYAHAKTDDAGNNLGIVHCDISPQNIMLSMDGFVKVLDFGVARAGFVSAPEERRLRGKPRYMAPEQTRGDDPTAATDVFALGIVAWELLTGRRLFPGDDLKAILRAVRTAPSPSIRDFNASVPDEVARAVARALEKEPGARGTTAELATVFARSARDSATTTMDKELVRWLRQLFPRPDMDSTQTRATAIPVFPQERSGTAMPAEMAPATDIDEGPPAVATQPPQESPTPSPAPVAADRKTRDLPAVLQPELHDEITEVETNPLALARAMLDVGALEDRRVVIVAVRIDGGSEPARADLRRSLGVLAFKRGAVAHEGGDFTAIFGLEVAGEDDIASAMHFALDALELAREASSEAAAMSFRIAARAGFFAHREGDGFQVDGDAIARTHELADHAEPGCPILGGGIGQQATSRYRFVHHPPLSSGEELVAVELVGPPDGDTRAQATHLRPRAGRFFGREAEVGRLLECLERAVDTATPIVVGIVGAEGLGKSRLIAEFAASAAQAYPALQSVSATTEASEAPFALVGEVLRAALQMQPGHGEAARAQLSQRLRAVLQAAGAQPQDVAEVIDVTDKALAMRDGARVADVSPPPHFLERVGAVLRRLRDWVTTEPRLLILEDLHRADPASTAALNTLLEPPHRPGADVVVLSAIDRELLPARIDTVIVLAELSNPEAARLVRDRLGADTSEASVSVVLDRAGGNPLLIEELARGMAKDSRDPGSVRDVLRRRVDALPAPARAALQFAAVLGQVFRLRLVDELAPMEGPDALRPLVDAGLIEPAEQQVGGASEGEYQFCHGLICEAVYDSLAPDQRREAHSKIGQLLAARYRAGRDEPPSVIAKHLALGGHPGLAGDYWQVAGATALGASFAESAVGAYSQALQLYRLAKDGNEERFVDALFGRAQARLLLGDHDGAGSDLEELLSHPRLGPRLAATQRLIAERAIRVGEFGAAKAAADASERAATETGDAIGVGEACRVRAEAFERLGKYEKATADARRAAAVFAQAGDSYRVVHAELGIGRVLLMRARYLEARGAYEPVLEHLRRWSDPWIERLAKNHMAVIELCLGNFEAAWEAARASLAICDRYGDRARAGDNHSVSGLILSEIGLFEYADDCFARALSIQDETGSKWARADCLVYAGANANRRGNRGAGRQYIDEAIAIAKAIGARYIEANALCALTELLLSDPVIELGRALDASAAAVEIAREADLVSAQILAQSRLAQVTALTGNLHQAVRQSNEAIALLEAQRHIEGPEEEVYFTNFQLRLGLGDRDALAPLRRAVDEVRRKLKGLDRVDWHRSFRTLRRTAAILQQAANHQL